jgi:antirestriction protein ArdC
MSAVNQFPFGSPAKSETPKKTVARVKKKSTQTPGLNASEQAMILPFLQYQSEPDSEGLNGAVSPDAIYSYITDLIINTINKVGHLPWQKEWTGSGAGGAAKNYASKKEYTGANFILNFDIKYDTDGEPYLAPIKFIQPYYLTFNQIREAKASLNKGSKAHRVIYYTMIFDYDSTTAKIKTTDKTKFDGFVQSNNLTRQDLKDNLSKIPVLKYYNVFRADDCTGLKFPSEKISDKIVNPIEEAQKIIDGYKNPPTYTFAGDRAFYQPSGDILNMPDIKAFSSEAYYYATYFHEMTHSTGAEKRLKRDFSGKFGSKNYAFEELIAELGAVFLCSESGILFHVRDNSAKYLQSWNRKLVTELENDNRFFLKASAQAQKATNHILGREVANTETPVTPEKEVKKVVENHFARAKRKTTVGDLKKNRQLDLFEGLNGLKNIETSTEKFRKMTVSELRKFTLDYYNENLKGKKVTIKRHLKEVVFVAGAGRKMLQPIYSEKVAVIEHLEELIKNSTYNNWGERKEKDSSDVLGYLNFKSKITIDGQKRHVRISVILDRDRKTKLKTFEVGANKKSGDLPKVAVASPKDGDKKPLPKDKDTKKGLNCPNVPKKPIEKPETVAKTPVNIDKNSLAYKMANQSKNVEYFIIPDKNLSRLLGKIEKKTKESVFISLTGGEGSMKTRMAFQFMNTFGQNYKVGHASIEEHPESVLYFDKAKQYLDTRAQGNIINPEVNNLSSLHNLILKNDVIVIDSFTKMKEIEKSFEVDRDLRKKYDGKLFIVIFQQTTNNTMRGGSKSQFDADIVLFTEKFDNYKQNYVYATKNRYSSETGLKFNIYSKSLGKANNDIGSEVQLPKTKKLSFKVK